MPLATLTSKGQLTVPKVIRERLGLEAGDRVDFRLEQDGSARMLPVTRKASEVFGTLSAYRKKRPVSVERMDENLRKSFGRRKR